MIRLGEVHGDFLTLTFGCVAFVFGVGGFAKWDLKVLGYSFSSDFSLALNLLCGVVSFGHGVRYFLFISFLSLFSESTIPFWLVYGLVVLW